MLRNLNLILESDDLQNGVFSEPEVVQDGVPQENTRIRILENKNL